ncbi:MAG TPA: hypothetical protein VLC10_03120 [Patescibacteria group bacterium]|nr:hypothetical protein [Patescibacteria group bacterium]
MISIAGKKKIALAGLAVVAVAAAVVGAVVLTGRRGADAPGRSLTQRGEAYRTWCAQAGGNAVVSGTVIVEPPNSDLTEDTYRCEFRDRALAVQACGSAKREYVVTCWGDAARSLLDPTLCAELGDGSEGCLSGLAAAPPDPDICDKLDIPYAQKCWSSANVNPMGGNRFLDLCKEMGGEAKDAGYKFVTKSGRESTAYDCRLTDIDRASAACRAMQGPDRVRRCWLVVAKASVDPAYCREWGDAADLCFAELAKGPADPKMCDLLAEPFAATCRKNVR